MNFMEYSNQTHSNIIPKESFENLIREVFDTISANLAMSFGPLGSHTTVLNGLYTSSTKDGFGIFKNIRFRNKYKAMIYNLIKAPCTTLNNTVGDATTTAIILTNQLFQQYFINRSTLETLYRLPRQFNKTWDEMVQQVIMKVRSYSVPVEATDYDTIYKLAYVTSNGNEEISRNIAETYQKTQAPTIKLKNSPTDKSYVEAITGFEFPSNLLSDSYVKAEDLSVEEKDFFVMVFDYKIDDNLLNKFIIPTNEYLKMRNKKKLLVLAPSYDKLVMDTVMLQYLNHEVSQSKGRGTNLLLSQYTTSKLEDHQLEDLATVLRTRIINQEVGGALLSQFESMEDGPVGDFLDAIFGEQSPAEEDAKPFMDIFGQAAFGILSCTNGSIFRVNDLSEYKPYNDALIRAEKHLEEILNKTEKDRHSYAHNIALAKSRIAQLKMENYLYYVGADSAMQQEILYDAVEDVIKCTSSAVKSGMVPGCQLSIIRACRELMTGLKEVPEGATPETFDKLRVAILEMIEGAVLNVYVQVLQGPMQMGIMKLVPNWEWCPADDEAAVTKLTQQISEKRIEILEESIEKNQVFDMETAAFNDNIMTSTETDTGVLLAASELVKLLISGNQCVFLDTELNDAHDETHEVYV